MYCRNHSDREATGACAYCGNLFCEECLVEVNGRNYCKEHVIKEDKTTMQQLAQIGKETVEDIKSSLPTKEECKQAFKEGVDEVGIEDLKQDIERFKKNPVKNIMISLGIILLIFMGYLTLSKIGMFSNKINYEEEYNVTFANKQQEELFDSFYNEYRYGNAQQGYYNIPDMIRSTAVNESVYEWEVNSESRLITLVIKCNGENELQDDVRLSFLKYNNGNWDLENFKYLNMEYTRENTNHEDLYSFLDNIYFDYAEELKSKELQQQVKEKMNK